MREVVKVIIGAMVLPFFVIGTIFAILKFFWWLISEAEKDSYEYIYAKIAKLFKWTENKK